MKADLLFNYFFRSNSQSERFRDSLLKTFHRLCYTCFFLFYLLKCFFETVYPWNVTIFPHLFVRAWHDNMLESILFKCFFACQWTFGHVQWRQNIKLFFFFFVAVWHQAFILLNSWLSKNRLVISEMIPKEKNTFFLEKKNRRIILSTSKNDLHLPTLQKKEKKAI